MEIFATNLRLRAQELGLANAEVARRAGLSERRYGHYVVGRNEPDLATLLRIAGALLTTPDTLLGVGDGSQPQTDPSRDRIIAAANALDKADREVLAACAEAIVRLRAG